MTSGGYTLEEVQAFRRANAQAQPGMLRSDEDWTNDLVEIDAKLGAAYERHRRDLVHIAWLRALSDGWGSLIMWVTRLESVGEFGEPG